MTVYNTERFVEIAIESIQRQTLSDFEFIIVDDGSTDNSPYLITKKADQDARLKIIRQPNQGIGAATARAILECNGEYIAIMDSDDVSLPNRLALQKKYLDLHPEIDAVGSQWRMLHADGSDAGIDTHPLDPVSIEITMYSYLSVHHPTSMIRRAAIDKVGGYSTDRACYVPDYDLFMRMQLAGSKFANLPNVLFLWRLNPQSTTHSKSIEQTQSVIQVQNWGFNQLQLSNPEKAESIARAIVYKFPKGNWQDEKISSLIPRQHKSLLFQTWETINPQSSDEALNRAVVLWLRNPYNNYNELHNQLLKNKLPWLASLVGAYHGLEALSASSKLKLTGTVKDNILLSLFIPSASNLEDFSNRLAHAISLQENAKETLQLIVFSATNNPLDKALIIKHQLQSKAIIIDQPYGWKQALKMASGEYFAYLEENFRFNPKDFLITLAEMHTSKKTIIYMIDDRYFIDATDDAGRPLLDSHPTPIWSRSTLLGRERVNLSNFIHRPSLLNGFDGCFNDCSNITGYALALYLITRNNVQIISGVVNSFIPGFTLKDEILVTFKKSVLDWYYYFGATTLPNPNFWPTLSDSKKNEFAKELSESWANNHLFINPKNIKVINNFYIFNTKIPLRYALFRHLLMLNKEETLKAFWRANKKSNMLLCVIYCIITLTYNRLLRLRND